MCEHALSTSETQQVRDCEKEGAKKQHIADN